MGRVTGRMRPVITNKAQQSVSYPVLYQRVEAWFAWHRRPSLLVHDEWQMEYPVAATDRRPPICRDGVKKGQRVQYSRVHQQPPAPLLVVQWPPTLTGRVVPVGVQLAVALAVALAV